MTATLMLGSLALFCVLATLKFVGVVTGSWVWVLIVTWLAVLLFAVFKTLFVK